MNSVGIDLHRNRSHIAVIDEHGELSLSRRIVNDRSTFLELLGGLEGESSIAVEATYGWEWLAELLEDAGYDIHLAHPLRTRAIAAARVKTDAVDAKTLAHLLRADLLPEAYVAPRDLRDVRELLRHRIALTRMRSALKNCAEVHHWWRAATRAVRADHQAPRTQGREGRRRPPDPDPQLLRPTRRRDPLPGAPQPSEREREAGGSRMNAAAHATASGLRPRPRCERNARASSLFVMASLTQDGRPLD
jgi:Transposase